VWDLLYKIKELVRPYGVQLLCEVRGLPGHRRWLAAGALPGHSTAPGPVACSSYLRRGCAHGLAVAVAGARRFQAEYRAGTSRLLVRSWGCVGCQGDRPTTCLLSWGCVGCCQGDRPTTCLRSWGCVGCCQGDRPTTCLRSWGCVGCQGDRLTTCLRPAGVPHPELPPPSSAFMLNDALLPVHARVYDFALPLLVIHAMKYKTAESLRYWWVPCATPPGHGSGHGMAVPCMSLPQSHCEMCVGMACLAARPLPTASCAPVLCRMSICPRRQITTLDTHDGMGVDDIAASAPARMPC